MLSDEPNETEVSSEDPFLALRREVQRTVIEAALDYIANASTRDAAGHSSFGRIVLPPRVGKTVIAARIIERVGGSAVFLAPKKTLVDQAADEMAVHLKDVPVYRLYSGLREVGDEGVLVMTYESFHRLTQNNRLPPLARNARLVFADEAHHSMTELRQNALRHGLHTDAVRIALTATPDFDEDRVLARFFPDLIHEMTIYEGVQMKLLAPVRASVYEVQVGAADVGVIGGEYNPRDIERVMTRMPLLKAIRQFRYAEESSGIPALICCATRMQARLVWEYLACHGPDDAPAPGLILGDMDDDSRRKMLKHYEHGRLDTLITVGVLIEGWNSPRCKLLIDASPSLSQVRAAQKYTRPMTKDGDKEARIIVLMPMGMELPVLPLDVFGPGLEELPEDRPARVRRKPSEGERELPKSAWDLLNASGVKMQSVNIRLRMLEDMLIHKVDIQKSLKAVRRMVEEEIYGWLGASHGDCARFMSRRFRVNDMKVSGRQILRFLGYRPTYRGFVQFMTRYFPKVMADRLLVTRGLQGADHIASFPSRRFDALRGLDVQHDDLIPSREDYADQAWLSELERPSGKLDEVPTEGVWPISRENSETDSPYEIVVSVRWRDELRRLLDTLSPMEARILRWRFGLDGEDELTFLEIGDKYNLSKERVRQIQEGALAKLRKEMGRAPEKLEKSKALPELPRQSLWEELEYPKVSCTEPMRPEEMRERQPRFRIIRSSSPMCLGWKTSKGFDLTRMFGRLGIMWIADGYVYAEVNHPDMYLRHPVDL